MKRIIRVLGVTLTLLVLGACSSNEVDNSLPEVNTNNLTGTYKYSIVRTTKDEVDYNNDGVKSYNLISEGYNACEFDNLIEITDSKLTIIKKGVSCSADEKNEVYQYEVKDYLWDNNGSWASNPLTRKGIFLSQNGKVVDTLKGVYIENDDNIKKFDFERYDPTLKQDIHVRMLLN